MKLERQVDFGKLKIKFLISAVVLVQMKNKQVQVDQEWKMD